MARATKTVFVSVSVSGDDERTLEQFESDIREALNGKPVTGRNVTIYNRYFLQDGKTWKASEFDEEKQEPKPGAWPYGVPRTREEEARIVREATQAGPTNPSHLRTVEETIAARKKLNGKKLPATPSKPLPQPAPEPEEIEVDDDFDLDDVSDEVEDAAESAANAVAARFTLKKGKK
jgi:hypothetical protein